MKGMYSLRKLFQQGAKHPWHKGRPGQVGGSASSGTGSTGGRDSSEEVAGTAEGKSVSPALEDAIRAAGEAMGNVKGRREEGYQDAYLALKHAARIAEEEGHIDMSKGLMEKAVQHKKWADKFKK